MDTQQRKRRHAAAPEPSRADYPPMEATVTITLSGPPAEIVNIPREFEEAPIMGEPVPGKVGYWRWQTERPDCVEKVIAFSKKYPAVTFELAGELMNGFTSDEVSMTLQGGSGIYRITKYDRVDERVPSSIPYKGLEHAYRIENGIKTSWQVFAIDPDSGEGVDVTKYLG